MTICDTLLQHTAINYNTPIGTVPAIHTSTNSDIDVQYLYENSD